VRGWEPIAYGSGSFVLLIAAFLLGAGGGWLCAPGVALAIVGLFGAVRSGLLGYRLTRQRHGWLALAGTAQLLAAVPLSFLGGTMVLVNAFGGFRRGRQLRKNGRLQLPPLGRGTGWVTLPSSAAAADEADATAVAAQWRENGRTEHASVAAFARLSLDLLGLGAPARLLAQAQADGQDEIRHAELCFSLAHSLDGQAIGPVAFPAAATAGPLSRFRRLALVQLAIDSLVEGALHEGLSAAIVARLAKACETVEIQPLLAQIAEDEGRHAAHAWDVLQWCLDEGGFTVRAALDGAVKALPQKMASSQPAASRDGAWIKYGIHDDRLEAEAYAKARASVVRRAEALIAA
jgi:tRNA isopentenyl-2-thiomethyl-A-37 hydroxylase MiaE